jgi:hypothetical protein
MIRELPEAQVTLNQVLRPWRSPGVGNSSEDRPRVLFGIDGQAHFMHPSSNHFLQLILDLNQHMIILSIASQRTRLAYHWILHSRLYIAEISLLNFLKLLRDRYWVWLPFITLYINSSPSSIVVFSWICRAESAHFSWLVCKWTHHQKVGCTVSHYRSLTYKLRITMGHSKNEFARSNCWECLRLFEYNERFNPELSEEGRRGRMSSG